MIKGSEVQKKKTTQTFMNVVNDKKSILLNIKTTHWTHVSNQLNKSYFQKNIFFLNFYLISIRETFLLYIYIFLSFSHQFHCSLTMYINCTCISSPWQHKFSFIQRKMVDSIMLLLIILMLSMINCKKFSLANTYSTLMLLIVFSH